MKKLADFELPNLKEAGVLILLMLSSAPAAATPIGTFDTGSLGITEISGPVIPGSVDTFDFQLSSLTLSSPGPYVTGSQNFGYLNVVSGSNWLIQNEPLPLVTALTSEPGHFWFTSPSSPIQGFSVILNNQPIIAPIPDSSWVTVGTASPSALPGYGTLDPQGEVGGSGGAPGVPPPAVAVIEGYLRGGVPDIKQLKNECGPTATTNSLLWLVKKYGLSTDKLPTNPDGSLNEQEILKQLADAMQKHNSGAPGGLANNWNPNSPIVNNNRGYPGLERGSLEAGKIDYLTTIGANIVVEGGVNDPKAQGASAFTFIKDELKKGQDVEFLIAWPDDGGFHWVTVTGFIDAGVDLKTLIVHDPLKGDGNNYWTLKDDGSFIAPMGTANRAVAESVPEPGTLLLTFTGMFLLIFFRTDRRTVKVLLSSIIGRLISLSASSGFCSPR